MEKYDYLIVGSGLYGSVCAHELAKAGKKVLVIEKRDHIGGNIYTKNVDGINVHVYGAHIFHTHDKNIWDYVNSFVHFSPFVNSPMAKYKDEIYNLPFNMNTFSKLFNVSTPDEARKVINEEKKKFYKENPKNLEEQALNLVGPTIYEKLIKGYTAKQWGHKCSELPAFIIDRIPVRFTYDNNYFDDEFQGIPEEGYTKLIEKLLEGIEVRLNENFIENKEKYQNIASKIIYTGQIDEFYDYIFGNLEYRSLYFETETLNMKDFQGNAVINFTDYEIPYTRIIEHKHFMRNCESEKTIISREYPKTWHPGDEPYYPVNNEKNNDLYQKYLEYSKKDQNIIFGGRLGLYKYFDMDDVISSALDLIKKLLK